MEILSLEDGTPTAVFPTAWALRMRVSMSAMGSVMLMREASYQLALIKPGISPRSAISRSLLRPSPNLRNTPRGRPVSLQRLRSEEHTSELQSLRHLVCRLLLEKKKEQTECI